MYHVCQVKDAQNTATSALEQLFDLSQTRDRLMMAMAENLLEKGYSEIVVADVVKRARVSRRTFYEEFADRGDCFLALCNRSSEISRKVIDAAADPTLPWEEQVNRAVGHYFGFMTAEPRLTHSLLFEIHALGERGLVSHRETHHAFTEQMLELAERSRENGAEIRALDYPITAAAVGAIYQLMQMIAEDEPRITVDQARSAAIELVLDVTTSRR